MTVAVPAEIAAAYQHCREVTRRAARNFYYGLKLAPEPERSALFTLYAWMRRADDVVDVPGDEDADRRTARIEDLRRLTDAALHGDAGDEPLWIALADVARRLPLERAHFYDMLQGQLDDLTRHEYETFSDLLEYCRRVASTVGFLCICILGGEGDRAREAAGDRGVALQLTNILRDYREDYDRGRVYLPVEDFDRHGLSPQQVRAWSEPARCERFYAAQITRAESYYERSTVLESLVPARSRPPLLAMMRIYHELLAKIRVNPARVVGAGRVRLNPIRKGIIAVSARRCGRGAWRQP